MQLIAQYLTGTSQGAWTFMYKCLIGEELRVITLKLIPKNKELWASSYYREPKAQNPKAENIPDYRFIQAREIAIAAWNDKENHRQSVKRQKKYWFASTIGEVRFENVPYIPSQHKHLSVNH